MYYLRSGSLLVSALSGNIVDEVDMEDLTIEQYLRLTQESAKSKYDSEDMEEEVEYMTDDEVVISKQEESNHGYTLSTQHLEEKDDVEEWLNVEITKHMSMQEVKSMKDALISIIKSIRQEMEDDIKKSQFKASTTNIKDEVSSITSNEVDKEDNYTSNTTPYAKDNIMAQKVYEYLGLDKLRGREKIKFNINSHQSIEKIYMVNIGQEEETFNPLKIGIDLFSYGSPACLQFEQRTRSYDAPNPQDEIAGLVNLSPDRRGLVKRWHVCKPIHVTYDDGRGEDCGMWLTCDPDSKFCFGYNEVFGVNKHGTLRQLICFCDHERRAVKGSYMGFFEFLQVHYGQQKIDDTTRERRIGHNNLHESDREFIFNEWILDSYDVKEEYAREIGGRSFICITDREDEAIPLGRINGARFKAMTRKELEDSKVHQLGGNYRDRLDS
ncbi:hypothetical protein Tco_1458339 [Tanacetum coccineum]